jgi:hypothetical protein
LRRLWLLLERIAIVDGGLANARRRGGATCGLLGRVVGEVLARLEAQEKTTDFESDDAREMIVTFDRVLVSAHSVARSCARGEQR